MNLIDVTEQFKTDDDCLDYLEALRWPDGKTCPFCQNTNISKIERKTASKNKRTRLYQCMACGQQFSPTVGTIFADSHLPLTKWFMGLALIIDAKKGMSANQLKQHLGIGSYRTAWYMAHRIRKAMEDTAPEKLTGIVEIDETYVGGKVHGKGAKGRSLKHKEIVIGIKQRGGSVRFFHAKDATSRTIAKFIKQHVSCDVEAIMTDDFSAYPGAVDWADIHPSKHKSINHSKGYYVDGDIHTNGIESAFSLLKRGIVGNFHWVSIEHLHRYLAEFECRFNERNNPERFGKVLKQMVETEPMTYKELISA